MLATRPGLATPAAVVAEVDHLTGGLVVSYEVRVSRSEILDGPVDDGQIGGICTA